MLRSLVFTGLGALAFYTCVPVPQRLPLNFHGIARWAPGVGLGIGGALGAIDQTLQVTGMPILVRSAILVLLWLTITGGLHLDGAMDTADGLAVLDPQRRLEVMADSRTGAFGVMAAIAILLLKTTALVSLDSDRWFALVGAAGWGRWGQLVAIARDPYLKPEGKGAFHKAAIHSLWSAVPSLFLLLGWSGLLAGCHFISWQSAITMALSGCTIALLTGAWFNYKLGGQTGDTYGAIVEWTEALVLVLATVLLR
ncbi:MAG: adenosylcobinamide-GDP ribazoletransferase [Leptodesmis sp.]|uniref:adenosylcobinamide-GDP ribazoletransferase n=1 Tax=Leptodesmis sp. TaxID=3100501 RepID=UPI003D15181D